LPLSDYNLLIGLIVEKIRKKAYGFLSISKRAIDESGFLPKLASTKNKAIFKKRAESEDKLMAR
jgi:hypothetical protein